MWVGWVTPDYHQHDMNFDLSKVRAVTVTMGDEQGNIPSRCGPGWGLWGAGTLGTALSFPPVFLLIFLPMAPILSFPSSSVFVNFGCAGSSLQHAKLSQVAVCGLVCPAVCRILVP